MECFTDLQGVECFTDLQGPGSGERFTDLQGVESVLLTCREWRMEFVMRYTWYLESLLSEGRMKKKRLVIPSRGNRIAVALMAFLKWNRASARGSPAQHRRARRRSCEPADCAGPDYTQRDRKAGLVNTPGSSFRAPLTAPNLGPWNRIKQVSEITRDAASSVGVWGPGVDQCSDSWLSHAVSKGSVHSGLVANNKWTVVN